MRPAQTGCHIDRGSGSMQFRLIAGITLAGSLACVTAAKATTLTGSFATWAAAIPGYTETTNTELPLYSTVTIIPLVDGNKLTVSGTADTLLQPYSGWIGWSGGYTGDIVDSTTNSETISFHGLNAVGMELSPDLPLIGPYAEAFTVTLSDGTSAMFSGSYPPGTTQFVGFYGSTDITSITISTANAPDFAFGDFVDVPEPASLAVLGVGLLGIGVGRWRRAG
jgi:hypothetical protein